MRPAKRITAADLAGINMAQRRRLDPHNTDKPEPIEILARMAGRTTFRLPRKVAGATAAVPVTPLDIAHAIATAQDKLGSRMAMAMACQRPWEYEKVEQLAHPRLLRRLRAQREHPGVVDGPKLYRARIALFDAFHNLVQPSRRLPLSVAARRAHMQRRVYTWLEHEAGALLEEAANTAAKDAVRFLFALAAIEHPIIGGVRAVSWSNGQILVWGTACDAPPADDYALDVADLFAETLARPRAAGILGLSRTGGRVFESNMDHCADAGRMDVPTVTTKDGA